MSEWTEFELENGVDIEWREGQETYGEYVTRKHKTIAERQEQRLKKHARLRAIAALPWGKYTHFAWLDENGDGAAGVECMRCMNDPLLKWHSEVIATHQVDMNTIMDAVIAHERDHHGGLDHE
jgi:hypothetical protein